MKNANRIKEIVEGYEQSIKELEQELSGENEKTKKILGITSTLH